MIVRSVLSILLGLCFILSISETWAESTSDAIKQSVTQHILNTIETLTTKEERQRYQNAEILLSDINVALNLKPCDNKLTVSNITIPANKTRQLARVSCSSPTSWSLYVPVFIKLPARDKLTIASLITRAKTLVASHLQPVMSIPNTNIASYDITLAENFRQDRALPRSCSELIKMRLKEKFLQHGSINIIFSCSGLETWTLPIPFQLGIQFNQPLTPSKIKEHALQYLEHYIQTQSLLADTYSRTSLNIKTIPEKSLDCFGPIEFQLAGRGLNDTRLKLGRNALQIICESYNPWQLTLPFDLIAYDKVAYAAKTVNKGQIITAEIVEWREVNTKTISPQQITMLSQVIGNRAKYIIPAGRKLFLRQLQPPKTVLAGDEVILRAETLGISVKIPGEALMDGSTGEQIRVRNKQSNKVVKGIIAGPGQVEVVL